MEGVNTPSFEFATAARVVFGNGRINDIGTIAAEYGDSAFIVTGERALRESGTLDRITGILGAGRCVCSIHAVSGEPTIASVDAAATAARAFGPSMVIAIGGGSALDAGKAVAGLAVNPGSVQDYLEGVGTGAKLHTDPLPLIAVPTTSGTGSEVTKNAVITGNDGEFKKSFRDNRLLANVALVDPELTHSMPPAVTAASGLDALTQLIESFTSNNASPVTDALALEGIRRAAGSLERAFEDGSNAQARSDMALASLLGGITLANAGLGAVHGMASPLGAHYPAPHGAVCAILLPGVVATNVKRVVESGMNGAVAKYRRVAELLTGADDLDGLVIHLSGLVARMDVPRLATWGVTADDVPAIVAESRGSSMRYNPVELIDAELTAILELAI